MREGIKKLKKSNFQECLEDTENIFRGSEDPKIKKKKTQNFTEKKKEMLEDKENISRRSKGNFKDQGNVISILKNI